MNAVNAMADKYNMPILYSCHPRSKKFIEQRGFKFDKRVIQSKPLGFHDYNHLQQHAFVWYQIVGQFRKKLVSLNFQR